MSKGELLGIFLETLRRLDPAALVREHLRSKSFASEELTVLALGKAAVPMAEAACEVLASRVKNVWVVAPAIPPGKDAHWIASSHPTPTAASEHAGRALLLAAEQARGEILALISGGGSSLAAVPAPGLSLADKAELCGQVAAAGAPIEDLNALRKDLSAIKGGRLALAARVPVHSLYLSDVVGDDLATIASGPTFWDPNSQRRGLDIVHRYLGTEHQGRALRFLQEQASVTTAPAPGPAREFDSHSLLAGLDSLARQAHALAIERGQRSHLLPGFSGPITQVALDILEAAREPGLWVAGGEGTLPLPAEPGLGGRAQHLALLMAERIAGRSDIEILVAGSDGIDGNSLAAGGLVDGRTLSRMMALGIDPERALRECDSGPALAAVGGQIDTGPTGVNHADLVLVRIRQCLQPEPSV